MEVVERLIARFSILLQPRSKVGFFTLKFDATLSKQESSAPGGALDVH